MQRNIFTRCLNWELLAVALGYLLTVTLTAAAAGEHMSYDIVVERNDDTHIDTMFAQSLVYLEIYMIFR